MSPAEALRAQPQQDTLLLTQGYSHHAPLRRATAGGHDRSQLLASARACPPPWGLAGALELAGGFSADMRTTGRSTMNPGRLRRLRLLWLWRDHLHLSQWRWLWVSGQV